jgi:transposase
MADTGRPPEPSAGCLDSQTALGFVVQPRRWVVGRGVAWFGRFRRLSKDYLTRPVPHDAWG